MLAILASLLSVMAAVPPRPPAVGPAAAQSAPSQSTDLRAALRRRLATLEAQQHGIFHEEVSADVASWFPLGQSIRETRRIVRDQDLGGLKRFKGEPHEGTTMYVAHFTLTAKGSDDVYVVIDFDFGGRTEDELRLKAVRAFLRTSNM